MSKIFTNTWVHVLVLLMLLAGAVIFSGSDVALRKHLQYATFDTFNRLHPREPSDRVAIVDLDEESLVKMGQWPWPRSVMGEMVTRLKALGAKVIAFDMVFSEPDRTSPARIAQSLPEDEAFSSVRTAMLTLPDNDEIFAHAISQAGNVVTGFTGARPEETKRSPHQSSGITFLVKDKSPFFAYTYPAGGLATNLSELSAAAAGDGSFMAQPDIDGIIRDVSLFVRYPAQKTAGVEPNLYPMLAMEALRVSVDKGARYVIRSRSDKGPLDTSYAIKIGDFEIPVESDARMWVYYRDIGKDEYVSAHRLFDASQEQELRAQFDGKIVFVGTSAEGLRDIRSTPLDIFIPGVEVHVNVVEQILQGKFLIRPDFIDGAEALIIGLAGFLIVVLAPFINVIWLGMFTVSLMGSMFAGSWMAYTKMGVLFDPVYPSVSLSVLFLVSALLSYLRSEAERRRVRQAFGLYISPAFMEELSRNPDKLKLGGEVRELTVLFSDIRSFTTISEKLSPEELIQLMNDFLTPMSDLVMGNRGTIDKYIGDAMMAFWNAPLDDPDHAKHACRAALKMNEALVPINEQIKAKAKPGENPVLLNAGIGINTGPCSVGNMGSRQRFAYSALGDAVNLASRLEGQTKTYGVNILIGEETRKRVPDMACLELDLLKVKGKDKPVKVFALVGDETTAQSEDFKKWEAAHSAMLAAYRIADFDCAAQDLRDASRAAQGQLKAYYDLYMDRIVALMKTPPPQGWDGVFTATSK